MEQTYNPSGRLAKHKLLSIGPLVQEFVCCIEIGTEGPFTEPQGDVLGCGGELNLVKVWNARASARTPFRV